jgi:hypothetical protein
MAEKSVPLDPEIPIKSFVGGLPVKYLFTLLLYTWESLPDEQKADFCRCHRCELEGFLQCLPD